MGNMTTVNVKRPRHLNAECKRTTSLNVDTNTSQIKDVEILSEKSNDQSSIADFKNTM